MTQPLERASRVGRVGASESTGSVSRVDAFIDESMRADGKGVVLAAVCVDAGAAGDARRAMHELLLGRQARIHFHDEGHVRRMAILETVARLHLPAIVAAAVSPVEPRAFERARRKCIERLAYEVPQRGVTALLLESRSGEPEQERPDAAGRVSP